MRARPISLRLRLTLLYSALLALLVIAGAVALPLTISRVTFATIEDSLEQEARRLVDEGWLRRDDRWWRKRFGAAPTLFQVRDRDGATVERSPNLGDDELPLGPAALAALRAGQPWTEVAQAEGGRLLVHSRALASRGEVVGIVQAARSLEEHDQAIATLQLGLLGAGLLSALAGLAGGWLLSGAALRPIDRITQTARAIGAERDFSRRVPYAGPDDELGRLAATLNTMLAELDGAYQQERQALLAQRRFVADASHELRTPLTTIRGNLELLGREPPIPAGERRAVLADSVAEAERLGRLVSDLLALARADSGWRPPLAPVDLAELADEACRQAAALDLARPISAAVPPGAVALASRDLLKQVLLILLDNAIRHTPPGSPVTVTAAEAGGALAISVRDRGPGIDPAELPRLFDRFYRPDEARAPGGAGLGLAIARALAEAQGGSLEAASVPGEGSSFTVRLPAPA